MKNSLKTRFKRILLPASLTLLLGTFSMALAEPGPVPLTVAVMGKLVEKTVQSKLIPYTVEEDSGMTLTLTALDSFIMDWERGEFYADIAFDAQYVNNFIPIPIRQSGHAKIIGSGLFAADEQKIGVKLLGIDDLKFDGVLRIAGDPIRQLLNRKLAGKVFWMGEPPQQSEALTQSDWTELLRIAVAKNLPISGTNGKSTVNITSIESIESLSEAGAFKVKLAADGCYKGGLLTIPYQGTAVVIAAVQVDPQELNGIVRVEEVQNVTLSNLPSFIGGMVRRSVSKKLQGTEFPFSWK